MFNVKLLRIRGDNINEFYLDLLLEKFLDIFAQVIGSLIAVDTRSVYGVLDCDVLKHFYEVVCIEIAVLEHNEQLTILCTNSSHYSLSPFPVLRFPRDLDLVVGQAPSLL